MRGALRKHKKNVYYHSKYSIALRAAANRAAAAIGGGERRTIFTDHIW
jgi:hypothetical protein